MKHLLPILLLLASALPLAADENADKLAKLEGKLFKSLASSHRGVAKWAKSQGLMRASYRHYMEAITLAPEDKSARRSLGFKKKEGAWVQTQAPSRADKVKGKQREAAEKALDKGMRGLRKKGAKTFSKLAKEAKKLGQATAQRQYLNRLLGYAPNDRATRKALGWTRVKNLWIRTAQKKMLDEAKEGWKLEKDLKYEKAIGASLKKRKSNKMFIGGPFKDTDLARMIQIGETTFKTFHALLSPKESVRKKVVVLYYMAKNKQFKAFIDKWDKGDDKRKSWLKTLSFVYIRGTPIILYKRIRTSAKLKMMDSVAYLTANQLVYDIGDGSSLPWILEGLSWEMSLRVLGTKMHWSVALSKSVSQFGAKNWDDHTRWKDYMRELVLLGQAPLAVNVLKTKNFNEIADERAAFAWSVANWLLETQPEKLGQYCRELAESEPDEALKTAFGWSFQDLDKAWKAYVIANY